MCVSMCMCVCVHICKLCVHVCVVVQPDARRADGGSPYLQNAVRIENDGEEEVEDDIDEEADKRVQEDAREPPDVVLRDAQLGANRRKRHKHVVTVDEREQALHGTAQGAELSWRGGEGVGTIGGAERK